VNNLLILYCLFCSIVEESRDDHLQQYQKSLALKGM